MGEVYLHPLYIVNEQSENTGIWVVAKTATEAYLQQELRRLHEAVENYFKKERSSK